MMATTTTTTTTTKSCLSKDRKKIIIGVVVALSIIGLILLISLVLAKSGDSDSDPIYGRECSSSSDCEWPFDCLDAPRKKVCLCPLGQKYNVSSKQCQKRSSPYCELCQGKEVLYSDASFCEFANTRYIPWCPKDLDVKFHLYTKRNLNSSQLLQIYSNSIGTSHFRSNMPTKILIHGYHGNSNGRWSRDIKNSLLKEEDLNIIMVDWQVGAAPAYLQACANTMSVGVIISRFIIEMSRQTEDLELTQRVHCIGYSLGAHVCGFVGKEIRKSNFSLMGRISGLDSAGPEFENVTADFRLDKADGEFVDAIHTDAWIGGWGIQKSIGHVDYYMNGGNQQPGCGGSQFCSHRRSWTYYDHSIEDWNYDPSGEENKCIVGYHVNTSCRGNYYPYTQTSSPYRPLNIVD